MKRNTNKIIAGAAIATRSEGPPCLRSRHQMRSSSKVLWMSCSQVAVRPRPKSLPDERWSQRHVLLPSNWPIPTAEILYALLNQNTRSFQLELTGEMQFGKGILAFAEERTGA